MSRGWSMRGPATRAAGSQGRLRHDAQFENVMCGSLPWNGK